MKDSTPKTKAATAAQCVSGCVKKLRPRLHASADSLFFVRLFARAYQPAI